MFWKMIEKPIKKAVRSLFPNQETTKNHLNWLALFWRFASLGLRRGILLSGARSIFTPYYQRLW